MVAYSFQAQFAEPILAGTKRQTIRPVGKRRHAKPGDTLQLYVGMRTKHCRLIATASCVSALPIDMNLSTGDITIDGSFRRWSLNYFAQRDGFASWGELREFWRKHHPGKLLFEGLLISWAAIGGETE